MSQSLKIPMDCPFCRYCGLPLHWEDGSFFGTLCLFGRGEALAGPSVRNLMEEFAASLEKDLELLDLRKSQDSPYEKYGQVMEAVLQYAPGGIFCYSAEQDEQFSYLSDNMLRFLGYTRREFVEKFSNRFSRMRAVRGPDGKTIRAQGHSVDVTKKLREADRLREERVRLKTMSEEFQKKLFTPFERENGSDTRMGTGLGLAITKRIVDAMT